MDKGVKQAQDSQSVQCETGSQQWTYCVKATSHIWCNIRKLTVQFSNQTFRSNSDFNPNNDAFLNLTKKMSCCCQISIQTATTQRPLWTVKSFWERWHMVVMRPLRPGPGGNPGATWKWVSPLPVPQAPPAVKRFCIVLFKNTSSVYTVKHAGSVGERSRAPRNWRGVGP